MAIKVKLTINVTSDFHLGTGTGRGRTTDAIVLTDCNGVPFISGSTIKGLCRSQACRLIDCFPGLGPKPIVSEEYNTNHAKNQDDLCGPAFEIFGGGSERRYAEQRVWFDHARALPKHFVRHMTRSGRSARDRQSGRARDKHLFFYEDSGPAIFTTLLTCDDDLSPEAFLLLVLSLRRIEALGGQRRRGKGRCECSVTILNAGDDSRVANLKGIKLPQQNDDEARRFQDFAKPILDGAKFGWVRSMDSENGECVSTIRHSAKYQNEQPEIQVSSEVRTSKSSVWLVFAVAQSPLTLGYEQAVDNSVASEDFISGTSLRGALAWQAIQNGLDPNGALFQNAFVREGIHFGPLYPASSQWISGTPASMPFPTPASFCTCKRRPGSTTNSPQSPHGLVDWMWGECDVCERCQAATKQADGFMQLFGAPQHAHLNLSRPDMHIFQRTAVDEYTQRGADRQLFGLESVQSDSKFAGYLWGEESLLQETMGSRLDKWTTIRVGKAKSRGQGVVSIYVRESSGQDVYPHLKTRQEVPSTKNSESDSANAEQVRISAEGKDPTFYLTLHSDLIAVDAYLRPVTSLTADLLWQQLNQAGNPPFKLEKGFVRTRRIGGYLGVVGLPRTPDIAIVAGSTWSFRWLDSANDIARAAAWNALIKAERGALGLRRGEGFGRIVLNHPVHVACWDAITLPSRSMRSDAFALFPDEDSAAAILAPDRSQQLAVELRDTSTGKVDGDFKRLLAELAQAANPLEEIQRVFDDYRKEKRKFLIDALSTVSSDQLPLFNCENGQTICIAAEHAGNPRMVSIMREALKKYSGEALHHV